VTVKWQVKNIYTWFVIPSFIIAVIFSVGTSVYADANQCDVSGDSKLGLAEAIYFLQEISGQFAGGPLEVQECGEPIAAISNPGTLSNEAKYYLLCQLNAVRSRTALGQSPAYGGGYHPVATNMRRLQWDDNLATVAANHAAQCKYEHNSGRTSQYAALLPDPPPGLYVGENIYASSVSPTLFSYIWDGNDYGIAGAESSWSSESDNWVYSSTYNSTCPGGICGHFTQNVWARTTKVGCGYYNCTGGLSGASSMRTFVVCNFETGGNYYGQSIYRTGNTVEDVCSEESNPGDSCENGLINPGDYSSGIDFECDVDGDGAIGLEEVVSVLRAVTGQ